MSQRVQIVKDLFAAFAAGDRAVVERRLAPDFVFSAPPDPRLDLAGYFERCWPGAGQGNRIEFVRLVESGDEVIATYELRHPDGGVGRNTEIFTFDGDRVRREEVYFGWTVGP